MVRHALFQLVFSSSPQGATRRPCRVHRCSVAVSVIVIFSIPSLFSDLGQCKCRAIRLDLHRTRRVSRWLRQQTVPAKSKDGRQMVTGAKCRRPSTLVGKVSKALTLS